ncbi:MAG: hypothetical protein IPN34_23135 [Planctomycetes bacterium]|nr:hypothetical protein [Planctomycetota bacterium]
MDESSFWPALEFRVCREMYGDEDCSREGLWCDGFLAHPDALDPRRDRIRGDAWVCFGSMQERRTFELRLPRKVRTYEQIPWAELLPPEDVTAWLTVDREGKRLVVAPADAVPDDAVNDAEANDRQSADDRGHVVRTGARQTIAAQIRADIGPLLQELAGLGYQVVASAYTPKRFGNWVVDLRGPSAFRMCKDRSQFLVIADRRVMEQAGLWRSFDDPEEFAHSVLAWVAG